MSDLKACVYDMNGKELDGFSVESVKRISKARIIGSPVEDGTTSFDNKVIDPFQLIVRGTIVIDDDKKWAETVASLEAMVQDREFQFYKVCDGAETYKNLILEQFPHERDSSKYDWIQCELIYRQALLISKSSMKTSSNMENSSATNTGYQNGVQQ